MAQDTVAGTTPKQWLVPLLSKESFGESQHRLTFRCDEPLEAHPGQFLMIRGADWGNCPLLPRPMSILTTGKSPSILVKAVGEATHKLAAARPGDLFWIHGPLGRGWSDCPEANIPVLVAGGVGVCPLLFFARTLFDRGQRPIVVYAGRTNKDLSLVDELACIGNLRTATEDGSLGRAGCATDVLATVLGEIGRKARVYACGPSGMMDQVVRLCWQVGVACEVSLETVMACGHGVCLGCAVPKTGGGYVYACCEGPCMNASTISWEP